MRCGCEYLRLRGTPMTTTTLPRVDADVWGPEDDVPIDWVLARHRVEMVPRGGGVVARCCDCSAVTFTCCSRSAAALALGAEHVPFVGWVAEAFDHESVVVAS